MTPFTRNCSLYQVHFLDDQSPVNLEEEADRADRVAAFLRALHQRGYLHGRDIWYQATTFGVYHVKAPQKYIEAWIQEGLLDPQVLEQAGRVEEGLQSRFIEGARLLCEGDVSLEDLLEEVEAYEPLFVNLNQEWVLLLLEPFLQEGGSYNLDADV